MLLVSTRFFKYSFLKSCAIGLTKANALAISSSDCGLIDINNLRIAGLSAKVIPILLPFDNISKILKSSLG